MRAWRLILVLFASAALGTLVFAEGAKRRGESSSGSSKSGASARQPSHSGSNSSSSSTSTRSRSSDSGPNTSTSSSSEDRSSSVSSRTGAERRQPRPSTSTWRRESRRVYYYRPYRHYPSYAYYPYWGYYDGYYYGYYGWRSPYWSRYPVAFYDDDFGSLRLLVTPERAEVFVDGYFAGLVDDFNGIFQSLSLRTGRHEITLKCDGYRTHRIKVFVPQSHTMKIRYDMVPGESGEVSEQVLQSDEDADRPPADEAFEGSADVEAVGRLKLLVRPEDAAVYLDGELQGSARELRELELPAGPHRIEVVRPGFATYERDVDVAGDEAKTLDIELSRLHADRP